jgi:mono/diheme cytochrome c family protein
VTPNRAVIVAACSAMLCAVTACNGPWRHDMIDGPSRPAGAGPRSAAPGTMPIDGELRHVSTAGDELADPIASSTAIATGAALYAVYCAPCHGMSGTGDGPVAKYYASVGDLTRRDVQEHSDGWLHAVIVNGTAKMPSFAHELDRRERWDVVRFTRILSGRAR